MEYGQFCERLPDFREIAPCERGNSRFSVVICSNSPYRPHLRTKFFPVVEWDNRTHNVSVAYALYRTTRAHGQPDD
jgi:hypothetical protein